MLTDGFTSTRHCSKSFPWINSLECHKLEGVVITPESQRVATASCRELSPLQAGSTLSEEDQSLEQDPQPLEVRPEVASLHITKPDKWELALVGASAPLLCPILL